MREHIDLTGRKFGRLTVTSHLGVIDKARRWECTCDCGNTKSYRGGDLVSGMSQSCGCLLRDVNAKKRAELVGQVFGRLTVDSLNRVENRSTFWNCVCECGNRTVCAAGWLKSGNSQSCGCLARDRASEAAYVHGMAGTRTHWAWKHMRQRCLNPKTKEFKHYGGRGITVCERWNSFENFLTDMGEVPEGMELDRIDVNGNYCPENCRWATETQQQRNRRNNRRISFDGVTQTLADWSDQLGITYSVLQSRLSRGWSVERAFTTYPPVLASSELPNVMAFASVPVVIEASVASEDGQVKLPTISMEAYTGSAMTLPGWKQQVIVDLSGIKGTGKPIQVLRNHDSERIIGHGTASVVDGRLRLEGVVSSPSADALEVVALAKNSFPWAASIGAAPEKVQLLKNSRETAQVNGQTVSGPLAIVRQSRLIEISVCGAGADPQATTSIAASFSSSDERILDVDFSAWIKAKGFDESTLTDAQLASLKAAYEAEQRITASGTGTTQTVEQMLAAARKREERHAAYGRIIQGALDRGMQPDEAERLVQAATTADMDEVQFELQILRASRTSPTIISRGGSTNPMYASADVIEAAVARSVGDQEILACLKPEVLEASERQFPHSLSLVELLQLSARRNGYTGISSRDIRGLLRAAFEPIQAKGSSTYDLGGVLSNIANKAILAGYNNVEQEWSKVCTVTPVNDFKEITIYSLTGDFNYKEVSPSGELTHATMGEEKYANAAKTYGRLFAITRTDLVNDDLGAFGRVRRMLGRGAALKFNEVFWTEFLNAVLVFHTAARKNFFAGAGSALDVDSLSKAIQMLKDQVDPDGNPMGLAPYVMAVPTSLEVQATRLIKDMQLLIAGTTDRTITSNNPNAGKIREIAVSSYLNNAKIPNGSADHWFVTTNPEDVPTIEAVFLYGNRQPIIEEAAAEFDILGIQLRGYHDFGVRRQSYRGSVMAKGS